MKDKKLLILNGSHRRNGTSYSFSTTVKRLSEEKGSRAEIIHVIDCFESKVTIEELIKLIAESDIIAMVAALYADTLPYTSIWLFEKLADEYHNILKGKSFFVIGQCGFPDVTRLEPMINACKFFAEETEMKWLGALAFGGGSILNGKPLEELGKKGQKITSAFNLALEDVLEEKSISPRAQEELEIKMSKILFRPVAIYLNHIIRKTARQNGVKDVCRKVYLE